MSAHAGELELMRSTLAADHIRRMAVGPAHLAALNRQLTFVRSRPEWRTDPGLVGPDRLRFSYQDVRSFLARVFRTVCRLDHTLVSGPLSIEAMRPLPSQNGYSVARRSHPGGYFQRDGNEQELIATFVPTAHGEALEIPPLAQWHAEERQ